MNRQHPYEAELLKFASGALDDERFEEVAAHLENCQKCGDVLRKTGAFEGLPLGGVTEPVCGKALAAGSNPVELPGNSPTASALSLTDITEGPGTVVGPYKLLQKLGEGGMGVVYMAEQEEPVRRMVALKIIKPGMDSKQVIARFEAERQALAMMDHHNIAKVLDAGTTDTGRPYFAMELVKGVPITEYCDKNKLTPRERLEMFIPVCGAIQHAHQKGIIHRDIKPSNVLVTLYDGKPVPKVIDFGIAKATQQKLTERTMFTGIGQILGTFEYMSPEQAEMNQLDVDTRTDVYSLGVMLYELLTGSTPITKEKLRSFGLEEMLRTIRETEPPKPSTRVSNSAEAMSSISEVRKTDPVRLSKFVRGDLDWIVMKALEKDRTRRYETANGLAADVQRFLDDQAVEACPPSARYKFRKFARRNKAMLATGTAIAGILLVSTVVSTGLAIWAARAEQKASENEAAATAALAAEQQAREEEQKQRELAEENATKAKREATKSREVASFLVTMVEGVGPSVARGRDTTMLKEILDNTADRLDTDLKDHPDVEAELRSTIGKVYFELSKLGEAEAMHRRALDLRKAVYGQKHTLVAESLTNLARALEPSFDIPKISGLYEQSLNMRKELFGTEHLDVADSMLAYGRFLSSVGQQSEAEPFFREALAIRTKLLGEHPLVLEILEHMPNDLRGVLNARESKEIIERAKRISRQLPGETYRHRDASLETLLGRHSLYSLEYAEAEAAFQRAITIHDSQQTLDEYHIHALEFLARSLESQEKYQEAEVYRQRQLEIADKLYGRESRFTPRILLRLGSLYVKQGQSNRAKSLYEEAIESRERNFPDGDGITIDLCCGLADVYEKHGQPVSALEMNQQAMAVGQRHAWHYPINGLSVKLVSLVCQYLDAGTTLPGHIIESISQQIAEQQDSTRDRLFALAMCLVDHGRADDAEAVVRQWLKAGDTDEPLYQVRSRIAESILGAALVEQGKLAAAERLLSESHSQLHQDRITVPALSLSGQLVKLYQQWGKPDKERKWMGTFQRGSKNGVQLIDEVTPPFDGFAAPYSSLHISGDGGMFYATSRRAASIDVFTRNRQTGALNHIRTKQNYIALGGVRSFTFGRTGNLASCNSWGGVLLLRPNTTDGSLKILGNYKYNTPGQSLRRRRLVEFSTDSKFIFVAEDSGDADALDGALVTLRVDDESNLQWQEKTHHACFDNSSGLVVHPNGKRLYVTSEANGSLAACAVDPRSGEVSVEQVLSSQNGELALVSPREPQALASGNIQSNVVSEAPAASAVGSQSLNQRQNLLAKPGRICCSSDGKFLYVSGEADTHATIGVFAIDEDGRLTIVQQLVSGADDIGLADGLDRLAITPSGSECYACAPKSGTLARFDRDLESGKLTFVETIYLGPPEGGPVDLCFSPDGSHLYVAIKNTQSIAVLKMPAGV